ncbi:hypothetical protein GGS23DRAFT_618503 [Durotheca rogersii]|uniref:uncharacterized protein n=1 Tax=Durotheca rogersii TaxID=419775 RepID=UPI002220B378|nr:uncharacterized protein GGS23DRAFT_618503 [Durotheca rogersii]KAI5865462.1 hypothetical protein GGS23DRAFT_618503 [Durotheca rogersii]
MADVDLDTFLQQGYWPSSRARSAHARRVEDEKESLAKEFGSVVSIVPDEEPIHRGELEQLPILLLIHEHNPERRFVLVSPQPSSPDDSSGSEKKPTERPKPKGPRPEPEPTYYEANTGRKFHVRDQPEADSEKKQDPSPTRENRRGRHEKLPAIITEINTRPQPQPTPNESKAKPTPNESKAKPTPTAAKPEKGGGDYFSPRPGSRVQDEQMLSPDIIEHGSRGRERVYYQGGSSPRSQDRDQSAHPNVPYSKSPQDDKRYKERSLKSAKSTSPSRHKRRLTAESPRQMRGSSTTDRGRRNSRDDLPSPRADRTSHARVERDSAYHATRSPVRRRDTPPYSDHFYSSDEEAAHQSRNRYQQEWVIPEEAKAYSRGAGESRSNARRRSRGPSPLPSPRTSQSQVYERDPASSSPRTATMPKEIRFSRSEKPARPGLSRTSTGRSIRDSATPMAIPATAATAAVAATAAAKPGSPPDPRRSGIVSSSRTDFFRPERRMSTTSAMSSSPQRQQLQQHMQQTNRQPPQPDSPRDAMVATPKYQTPPAFYGRYLDELQAGRLPDTRQRCPRQWPVAGYVDWLTLPRCDNLHVCPACYDAAFAGTAYARHLVPAPLRPPDRPITCDLGSAASPYIRIAYHLSRKRGAPDLSLLRRVADVVARSPPCCYASSSPTTSSFSSQVGGADAAAARIWYSVMDPRAGRAVAGDFTVCYGCARALEALLPNLTGLFVPTAAEPRPGACAMRLRDGARRRSPSAADYGDDGDGDGERRFALYFDVLEAASDAALATQRAPDVQALADRLRDLAPPPADPPEYGDYAPAPEYGSGYEYGYGYGRGYEYGHGYDYGRGHGYETPPPPPPPPLPQAAPPPACARGLPVHNGTWYTTRSSPEMAACEACFSAALRQLVEESSDSGSGSGAAAAAATATALSFFHRRPVALPVAACELYSPRMREALGRAARRGDPRYLAERAAERRAHEREFHDRAAALDREIRNAASAGERAALEGETRDVVREWRRWE